MVTLTAELVGALSEADRALGRLDGVGRRLPNPHLLIGPFVRREAVLSSRIEGTQAQLSDLYLFDVSPTVEPKVPDVREVANYVLALEQGLRRLADLPLSLRLIRELHEQLMAGARGEGRAPGEFRRTQNWIGPPDSGPGEATFMPPPPPAMEEALGAFETYLHSSGDLPPLIQLALIHYQFEAIHPFLDGNGRIGRLLITLWLCNRGLLCQPLLYLSAYFEQHRSEYYRLLLEVSQKGHWVRWATFFLVGVAQQAADAIERANRLLALRDEFHSRLQTVRGSVLAFRLVDELFNRPYANTRLVSRLLEVTHPGAQGILDRLVEANILCEITQKKRNRIYVAEEIMDAIEGPLSSS